MRRVWQYSVRARNGQKLRLVAWVHADGLRARVVYGAIGW
jgi:hypothetical protein